MRCVKERVLFVIRIAIHAFGGIMPMWISRKKYEKMEADINWLQAQVDALYTRVREHNIQITKNTADIHNNVHYIAPPSDGKKVLHG
jgi:hypothetical protein